MALYHEDIISIDLAGGNIHRNFLKHSIGKADVNANRFGIRAFKEGVPVDLSGASCQGYFRNAEGTNIALTSYGTVNGNVAYVTLPAACYNVEGMFTLAIKVVGGGVTGTMRIIDGMVDNTNTGGAVAPTSSVPTYSEIIAQYDAMAAATSAANTAIAETFDATKVYPVGKYVINNGALYRLTADHEANVTWNNTSKIAAKMANDETDLKSAIEIGTKVSAPVCEIGTLNLDTGNNSPVTWRVRSAGFVPLDVVFIANSDVDVICVFYDDNFERVGAGSWRTLSAGGTYIPVFTGATYIRFVLSYVPYTDQQTVYTTAELTKKITIKSVKVLKEGNDLDDCKAPGLYISPSNAITETLVNCPIITYGFTMEVKPVATGGIRQTIMQNTSGAPTHVRQYVSSSTGFYPWRLINTKYELTVMSYNICHYNFDEGDYGFPPEIMEEKITNLKKMFMRSAPDMIGLQEDAVYIDKAETITSYSALFSPVWKQVGEVANTIRSKYNLYRNTQAHIMFTDDLHGFRRGIYIYESSKRILFISAHVQYGAGAEDTQIREIELEELFEHINDTADEWDYCIVTGDFNTVNQSTKEKLVSLCEENGFNMAIGTYMPWIVTRYTPEGVPSSSLDNILVSGNIDILSTDVLTDQFSLLYSDHLPMIARLRLN